MMYRTKFSLFVVCALFVFGCQEAPTGKDLYLVYMETESGVDPYQTRIIVTPQFVRLDDGEGSKDYVVFDRASRTIHSINAQTQTVMQINDKKHDLKPPVQLVHTVKDLGEMKDAPTINQHVPHHYQYLTNDTVCVEVVSLPDLMPEATLALREFHEVLASDSAATFHNLPADLHVPCEISMTTFAATQFLQNGIPLREWKPGYSRMLVDYKENYKAEPALFVIPKNYFTYSVQQMREGKVDFGNREMLMPEQ